MSDAAPHGNDHRAPAATRAGGSSFYMAMRILPKERREAMFEIYSFCRAVDDIADGGDPRPRRLRQLDAWRHDIGLLYCGEIPDGLEALAAVINRFGLQEQDFLDVIEGMRMDAETDIRAPRLETLELYCDRVASAVGRLSVRIFGIAEPEGHSLAHHLGRALQFTNILRDVDEDAAIGRLYLPAEALRSAKIADTDPASIVADPRLPIACNVLAERAREHFARASEIMSRCTRRVVRAPRIMAEVYRQLLEDMIVRGWDRPRRRVHVNKSHLIWIALRHAFV